MNCPNCNSVISDDSKFCTKCGHKIERPEPMQASPEAQTEPLQATPEAQSEPMQTTPEAQSVPQTDSAQSEAPKVAPGYPAPQQFNQAQSAPQQFNQAQPAPVQSVPKKPVNKKKLGIIIGAAAALVIVIIAVAAIAINHKTTIDLQDYVTVDFYGTNGYGYATVEFDKTALYADIIEKGDNLDNLDVDDYSLSNLYSYIYGSDSKLSDYYNMIDSINCSYDSDGDLSNGDKYVISFTFDNDYAKEFKLKFVGDDMEVEVEGLEDVEEIDPFKGVYLSFSGTSPNAYASVECSDSSNEFYNECKSYYELSKDSGIAKGDVITLSIDEDNQAYFAENYGFKLTSFSKDFTCDSLDSYITSLGDIGEDTLDSMKSQTEDVIEAYFADNKSYISYKDLAYEGCYFLTAKSSDTWNEKNICYVVYSAKVSSVKDDDGETSFDTTTVYFPVKFTDIIEYSDGSQYVDITNGSSISGSTSLSFRYTSVKGYTKKDVMYSELVSAEKGSYTAEASDGLED